MNGKAMLAMAVLCTTPGVVAAGYSRGATRERRGYYLADAPQFGPGENVKRYDAEPRHGVNGWELAKYEWREDGTARFLYVRDNGDGEVERVAVTRDQKEWL